MELYNKIYTHLNLDLDAASSTAIAMIYYNIPIENVIFTTPDIIKYTNIKSTDLILDIDHPQGLKGNLIEVGGQKYKTSAFTCFLEKINSKFYKKIFKNIGIFVDAVDAFSDWTIPYDIINNKLKDIPTLQLVFKAFKSNTENDYELLSKWKEIFYGMIKLEVSRLEATELAKIAEWYTPDIAIIEGVGHSNIISALFNEGAKFVIYSYKNNIGVVRQKRLKNINLGAYLKNYLPDWFHHEAGFLSCWGSSKNPKDIPYDITTKQLAEYVIELSEKLE